MKRKALLSTQVVYKGEPKLTRKPIRQPKQQEKKTQAGNQLYWHPKAQNQGKENTRSSQFTSFKHEAPIPIL